jgi:hypothetical protein
LVNDVRILTRPHIRRRTTVFETAEALLRAAVVEEKESAPETPTAQDPGNGYGFFRCGRIRLMQGRSPDDDEWNNGLTGCRILDAAFDLAHALKLGEEDEEARHCLRWLIDRMCTTHRFRTNCLDGAARRDRRRPCPQPCGGAPSE